MKYTYKIENIDCAHCAQKIEQRIAKTDDFKNVSLNFATKTLRLESEKTDPLPLIQQICNELEDGVVVYESIKDKNKEKTIFNTEKILLFLGVLFGVSALIAELFLRAQFVNYIVLGLSATATLLAGWKVFIKGLKNLIKFRIEETVLMTIAVVAAFILGECVEGTMVILLFVIGEMIENYAVDKSRNSIEKLSQIRPDTATLCENGTEKIVPAEKIKTGSIIKVRPHERIPLDGVVVDGDSTVDNSVITGESIPQDISKGTEVYSGGINGEGVVTIETTKEYSESTATRILKMVEDSAANKGTQEKFITRFAAVYTPIVVCAAIFIAVFPPLFGAGSLAEWIHNALVVLVASCPCAIVISVPLSYYSGIGAAAKNGVLIKGGNYLEALAKADIFAFDKTGTLTKGKLTVKKVYTYENYSEEEILSLAAACETYSTHPIAIAIKNEARKEIDGLTNHKEVSGQGTFAIYKNKTIACGKNAILHTAEPEELKQELVAYLIYDDKLIGAIVLSDNVREEAASVVSSLKKLKIQKTLMLTGDKESSAETIKNKANIDQCYSNLLPEQKVQKVEELRKDGHTVCFVGDGINDAPVLTASDCGIAMGLGSDAAIETSNVVLSSGELKQLPFAVAKARATIQTLKFNIAFALLIKVSVILLACFGIGAIWMSVIADTGVCVLCVLNSARLLRQKSKTRGQKTDLAGRH